MKYALPLALTLAVALGSAPQARAQAKKEDPLAKKVRDAIDSGVKYLHAQGKDGNWEGQDLAASAHPTGWSALALLALLNSGEGADSSVVKNGLEYLRKHPATSTYSVSLQTMVFAQAGQTEDKERIQKNVDWLLAARMKDGWTYNKEQMRGNTPDNSNTQYALLGLHEGRRAGAIIDPKVMKELQEMYLRLQNADTGSWEYSSAKGLTGPRFTMTTAGVCGLLITGMNLDEEHKDLEADGSDKQCGKYKDNTPVTKGLKWLGDRFPARLESSKMTKQQLIPAFYCLYGLERCGRLSGERYLGDKDWYRIGCQYLVENQNADGSWKGALVGNDVVPGEPWPVVSTSFSLLFLSKGRTPVLWTKMAWGDANETGWNNKHNDARNVVEFASKELFKNQPMAWQVFDVRTFDATTKDSRLQLSEELLQSPIVFLNGHYLKMDDKQKDVLKEYMANGGFLFAEACCNKEEFKTAFTKLMEEWYPDSKLTELLPGHPVWTAKYPLAPDAHFKLYGIQQGCKTVVVFSPNAISGYWEANKFADKDKGTKAFQLAANVIAYATGLEPPKPKGYEIPIVRGGKSEEIERGYLKVAQLVYQPDAGTEWQPAPKAMRNLMEECRKVGLDVVPETRGIDLRDENVVDYRFLYMHGRTGFKIPSKEELKSLRFNLEENGGLLLADACCGSAKFDESFRKLIEVLWPDKKMEAIPVSDDLFSRELNGKAITQVRCRREGPDGKPDTEFRTVAPALEGIKIKGRWVVIYSKYDIGCALENNKASDCKGHDRDSAVLLARAAVLYAVKR
jgi:Domain of unknown function (DUF4159)